MRSTEYLTERIATLRRHGRRLDGLDWLHRMWVADYDADVHIVADELDLRLHEGDGKWRPEARSIDELRMRIASVYLLDERWYKIDFDRRRWLAEYVAAADAIADALTELLTA
jgi:hypothetical protein